LKNQLTNLQYPFLGTNFLKAYIITMRPYLLFVSGITGIAGMSFITELLPIKILLLFIASFLSYGFGQALTDCFQIDTDSISSPYRPLTQGIVSKPQFLSVSIVGLVFCISIFTFYNPYNIFLGMLSGLGLASYTYFKRKWWAGPFYNASIVAVLFLMAFLCDTENLNKTDHGLLSLSLFAVFFGYANFVLAGYFKDICADKATGYFTFPVVFGKKSAAIVSDIFAGLYILFVFSTLYYNSFSFTFPTLIFLLPGFILSLIAQVQLHKVKNDDESHGSIELVVHCYILLLSSIAVSQKPEWFLPLLIFYASFIIVIKLRPMKNQI